MAAICHFGHLTCLYSGIIKQKIKFLLRIRFLVIKLKTDDTDFGIFQNHDNYKIRGGGGGFACSVYLYHDCKA
jgi:hypothetical protein